MAYPSKNKGSSTPSFQDLVNQDLKTGKFRPVYLLAGEDSLRIEGVVEKIRKDALGDAASAFNYHVMQGDQEPVARILQQALALPMMSGVQLIWVKHADRCLSDADSQASFEKYLARPVPETILILSADKVDKRKKWVKTCQAQGFLFDFTPPSGEALIQWVLKAAGREGLAMGHEEAAVLCDLVGNDLMSLKSEIDKLALLAEDRGSPLSPAEIRRIIMDQAALEGYEITANLQPGRTADVLKTWFRLAEWGKTAYEISPLVLSRVRKGSILAFGRQAGLADCDIGALTGQNPWSFRYLEPLVRGQGVTGMDRALKVSLDCDRMLKSSPLKPDIIIEKTIMELCKKSD
jgi:DNA polymerase-3 subunit delta